MIENETVEASLDISMYVDCPNKDCGTLIDLLNSNDTNRVDHNEDSQLMRQMFPSNGTNDDFECDNIVCTSCQMAFNVKGLAW